MPAMPPPSYSYYLSLVEKAQGMREGIREGPDSLRCHRQAAAAATEEKESRGTRSKDNAIDHI